METTTLFGNGPFSHSTRHIFHIHDVSDVPTSVNRQQNKIFSVTGTYHVNRMDNCKPVCIILQNIQAISMIVKFEYAAGL